MDNDNTNQTNQGGQNQPIEGVQTGARSEPAPQSQDPIQQFQAQGTQDQSVPQQSQEAIQQPQDPVQNTQYQVQNLPQQQPQPQVQQQPNTENPANTQTPIGQEPKQKGSNKMLIVGLILLGLAIGVGAISLFLPKFKKGIESQEANMTQTPTKSVTKKLLSPTTNPKADWKAAATDYYTIKYPSDAEINIQENTINISKWGPTQTEATELFDGYSVTIESVETSQTPEEYADTLIAEVESAGIGEITEGSEPVTINGYKGVTYTEKGLGTFKHIILGSDNSSVLIHISVLVSDPGGLGFQKEVDQILSTLKFVPGV
ncbi:MAG: hypothetical protein JXB49_05750 [Bacteroidales bacterium]|nr:hypothetical protein [Bacteroidales bacterium]